ncbi:unnamed protein product [Thlaspi arvense]|uniref:Uncharacterized protein n=1 Tax=Thlaspi arvense TaxID=13288 RepID=A0AAU9SVC9_THLAR|nr:unnamed protein product [Thlaspi arvense]
MEVIGFSGETEIAFSETEMEAAEQLVQLSEEDTMSCSSGSGWSVSGCGGSEGGGNTKKKEDVVSSEIHDMVGKERNDGVRMMDENVKDGRSFMRAIMETKTRRIKKKKFRSLASIYRATKEMTRD